MKGVSIVICCFNSERRIERTLIHIDRQVFSNAIHFEVIIVDNGSEDKTKEVAKELWRKFGSQVPLRIIEENRKGLRFAREKGLSTAIYDYIIFVDDDNWLSSEYVSNVYHNFEKNSTVALIGGLGNPVSDSLLPIWYTRYQKLYAVGKPVLQSGVLQRDSGFIYGAGMALRKSAYQDLRLRGFYSLCTDRKGNQLLGGHDVELSFALRLIDYDVIFDEQLVFAHYMDENRLTLSYLKRLSAGSAANTTTFIYYLLLNRKVKTNIKFTFLYFKRVIGDLIDFLIVLMRNPKNHYEVAIVKATYLSSIKHFAGNFFPSLAYYRNLKSCMRTTIVKN